MKKSVFRISFCLYVFFVLYLLIFIRIGSSSPIPFPEYAKKYFVLFPFHYVSDYQKVVRLGIPYTNMLLEIIGNVLLFIPFGFFLPKLHLFFGSYKRFILCVVVGVCVAELIQLFAKIGCCDGADVFHNCLGATIGYYGTKGVEKIIKALKERSQLC